jgi:hypothetical protein
MHVILVNTRQLSYETENNLQMSTVKTIIISVVGIWDIHGMSNMSRILYHMQLSDMTYQCDVTYQTSHCITETLLVASKEISLEANTEKPSCRLMSCEDDTRQNYNKK